MPANNFTDQVYKKASDVFDNQTFEQSWDIFLRDTVHPRALIAADGPDTAHAEGVEKLRSRIAELVRNSGSGGKTPSSAGQLLLAAAKTGTPPDKWRERAAGLKLLKHFYRHVKTGAQDIWVYSPPKDYASWIFSAISGSETEVVEKLDKEDEVYSTGDKDIMCDALRIALTCSQKTEMLLAAGAPETLEVVTRWFGDATAVTKLAAGFKKITAVCNANTLVFPDDPNDRVSASKYDKLYGSVWPGGEGSFYVIYLAGAFKKSGSSGKLWLCAQTILHEASHLVVSTKDHRYDSSGLKPGSAELPASKAIENADTWGYFSIDLCGYLSQGDRERVLV